MHHSVYVVEENETGKPKRDGKCLLVPKVQYSKWRRAGYRAVSDPDGVKRMAKQRSAAAPDDDAQEPPPDPDPDPDPDKLAA